jgi:hypothetical protein
MNHLLSSRKEFGINMPDSPATPIKLGRPSGIANKRTEDMLKLLEKAYPGEDPVLWMWQKVHDGKVKMDLRVSCAKEVAQYMHAKRRATEVTGAGGAPLELVVHNDVRAAESLLNLLVTIEDADPS